MSVRYITLRWFGCNQILIAAFLFHRKLRSMKQKSIEGEKYMEKKEDSEFKIAIVGLGYVGMPLAVAFSEQFPVIGFDVNSRKIAQYKKGIHKTKSCWWLRTPGAAANSMSFVYKDKTVMEYGYEVTNTKITVKPAIWVTVE